MKTKKNSRKLKRRDHGLAELTKECDGIYVGDAMKIINCSCVNNKTK